MNRSDYDQNQGIFLVRQSVKVGTEKGQRREIDLTGRGGRVRRIV